MPFQSTSPVVHEGTSYPYFGVLLVTSPGFGETSVSARVCLRLEPYRIDEQGNVQRPTREVQFVDAEGNIQTAQEPLHELSQNVVIGDAYSAAQSDAALAQALGTISAGIQAFIAARGL